MDKVQEFAARLARRLGAAEALRAVAVWLCAALGVAVALVLAERLLGVGMGVAPAVVAPVGLGLALAAASSVARWPGRMAAARRADTELGLEERLSSALSAGEGPMADLVRADAARRAEDVDLRQSFAIRWPALGRALPVLAALLVVAALVPELDLAGWGGARRAGAAEAASVRAAARQAQRALGALGDAAGRRGDGATRRLLHDAGQAMDLLARTGAGAAQAAHTAAGVEARLDAARRGHSDAVGTAPSPEEVGRRLRRRDLLSNAARALRRFRAQVAGGAAGGVGAQAMHNSSTRHGSAAGPRQGEAALTRPQATPPVARAAAALAEELSAARGAADEAMARHDVPWRYRAVVKRYFTPHLESGRPSP